MQIKTYRNEDINEKILEIRLRDTEIFEYENNFRRKIVDVIVNKFMTEIYMDTARQVMKDKKFMNKMKKDIYKKIMEAF